jgi:hypothetical protein
VVLARASDFGGLRVYRGFRSKGTQLAPLYESMVGEMFVWCGFTSTSRKRERVIRNFVRSEEGILFDIIVHPRDVVASIGCYSQFAYEAEVVIAASSIFRVVEVEINRKNSSLGKEFAVPMVTLSYCGSWFDFDIDEPPPTFLIQ